MKADTAEAPSRTKSASRPRTTANERIWREVVSWFWVIVAFLLIEGTLVQARVIPSGSMENTVLIGDHLIVSRFGYDAGVPFTRLARAPMAQPEAAADHRVPRAAAGRGLSGFHQALHRRPRRPHQDCRRAWCSSTACA